MAAVTSLTAGQPDVRSVVRTYRRCDWPLVENPFANSQHVTRAGAHQHDIDQLLIDDLTDLCAELLDIAVALMLRCFRVLDPGGRDAIGHVRVFSISQNK